MDAAYDSLGSLLGDLRGLFPPALIGDPGWERLHALTRRLPFCAADSRFGFEFHLYDPRPTADFFVIASPKTRLAEFYGQQSEETAPSLAGNAFSAFIDEQARDSQSFLIRMNRGIILEYDLAMSPPGRHDVPGVFIVALRDSEFPPARLGEDLAGLLAALRSAAGWNPYAAETRQIKQAAAALTASGVELSNVGVLPGRADRAIRLVAVSHDNAKFAGALKQLQWPGDLSRVNTVLSSMEGLVSPTLGINIDITSEGVSSRLGLEFFRMSEHYRPFEDSYLGRTGWNLIIDRLEEKKWCLPDKAGGLREWPRLEVAFGRDGVYRVRQIITHFKVAIDPDRIYSKAYVGMDVRRTTSQ
ncbi:MAG: hypothetical protein F4X34_01765 [Chloroflexi bacterium]|nr:hypothetical protein [Chloroflexota bacterium]